MMYYKHESNKSAAQAHQANQKMIAARRLAALADKKKIKAK